MPKFAIYYIPEADTDFYKLGSAILGYDVRAKRPVKMPAELRRKIKGFNSSWGTDARPYGFHLTIGDSIDFNIGDIHRIEAELTSILRCFATKDKFTLRKCDTEFIPNWGPPVVLRYNPNDQLKLLHALVISRINTIGIGSGYLARYLKAPEQYKTEPHKADRIKRFYSPFVLSDFYPHFSLLNPYTGGNRQQLVQELEGIFGGFTDFEVNSICIMVQFNEGENWIIYREIHRKSR
jgi:hypothetical protein